MEIQLGDFYFKAEGTVAILLAAAPALAIFTIPKVTESIKHIIYLLKRYRRPNLQERIKSYETETD